MDSAIVSVRHLWHTYGARWAVRDISFDIVGNGVVGLLGSNGAGKSTTMNIICGVLNQTRGEVFIGGMNLRREPLAVKRMLGFLPQQPPLHTDLTVREYLTHCAHLRLMPPSEIRPAVDQAMERCAVAHFSDRLIRNLSGGYQQRVGIAQAIVHRPRFVVFDEPTNGLDPMQIVEIRGLIREIARDCAVLLSTHILSEVQAVCREIRMIEHGELVFAGTMDAFDNYIEPASFVAEFGAMPDPGALRAAIPDVPIEPLDDHRIRIRFAGNRRLSQEYIERCVERNWDLRGVMVERCTLDEVFASLSKRNRPE